MSSILYQLSYNLYADKGFAPIYSGHEPTMLLLHQSAKIRLDRDRTCDYSFERAMSYHLTTNPL